VVMELDAMANRCNLKRRRSSDYHVTNYVLVKHVPPPYRRASLCLYSAGNRISVPYEV
jgi:hypothetical protein